MSLRIKLILYILALSLFIFISLALSFQYYIAPNAQALDEANALIELKRAELTLTLEQTRINDLLNNLDPEKLNNEFLISNNINFAYIEDVNNNVMWKKLIKIETKEELPNLIFFSKLQNFLKNYKNLLIKSYFFSDNQNVAILSVKLTPNAKIAIGRLVDPQLQLNLGEKNLIKMQLWPIVPQQNSEAREFNILYQLTNSTKRYYAEWSNTFVKIYSSISDYKNEPIILISVTGKTNNYTMSNVLFNYFYISLIIFMIFIYIFSSIFVDKIIELFNYIQNYFKMISVNVNPRVVFNINRNDELNRIATPINLAFKAIELDCELKNRESYKKGLTHMGHSIAKEINEVLVELNSSILETEKKWYSLPINEVERITAEFLTGGLNVDRQEVLINQLQSSNSQFREHQKNLQHLINDLRGKIARISMVMRRHFAKLEIKDLD